MDTWQLFEHKHTYTHTHARAHETRERNAFIFVFISPLNIQFNAKANKAKSENEAAHTTHTCTQSTIDMIIIIMIVASFHCSISSYPMAGVSGGGECAQQSRKVLLHLIAKLRQSCDAIGSNLLRRAKIYARLRFVVANAEDEQLKQKEIALTSRQQTIVKKCSSSIISPHFRSVFTVSRLPMVGWEGKSGKCLKHIQHYWLNRWIEQSGIQWAKLNSLAIKRFSVNILIA